MSISEMERMTIHLRLAMFYTPNPDEKIVSMAKRYLRKAKSSKVKKPLRTIINSPTPSTIIKNVYEDHFNG